MKQPIALQLYSVREDLEQDFYGTLKKVRDMGYNGVEFAGLYGHDPVEVKQWCEELGLVAVSSHIPLSELLEDLDGALAHYAALGCRFVVIPYLPEEYRPGLPGFEQVLSQLKPIGEAANRRGLVLQYHNHDFEFERLEGGYALDVLYEAAGPEYLQTQLDTCWINVAGEDPIAYLHKYAGRIPTVHMKDFSGSKTEGMYGLLGQGEAADNGGVFEFRALGRGRQDVPALVQAAREGGAEWFIVEQDSPSQGLTALESAKISADYLLSVLG